MIMYCIINIFGVNELKAIRLWWKTGNYFMSLLIVPRNLYLPIRNLSAYINMSSH